MAFGLKKLIAVLAAAVFSVGHVACACLPGASAMPVSNIAAVAEHSHEMAAVSHRHGNVGTVDQKDDAPCGPSESSCENCLPAQFAAAPDAAKLAAPAQAGGLFIAVLPYIISAESPRPLLKAAARLRWTPPPGLTPVSLKIRLLI